MSTRKITQDELVRELRDRCGDDPMRWAFQCPNCKDVATGQDFHDALAESGGNASDHLGQECIGRRLGALTRSAEPYRGRGCDWAAYGLFRGPWLVTLPDGKEIGCFPIADAPRPSEAVQHGK